MKIIYFLLLVFFGANTILFAQYNLVPNPSFEDYNTCPSSISGFAYSSDLTVDLWYSGSGGSSDYFNACAGAGSWVGVPENLFATDQPAHTGDAYGGFWTDLYDDGSYDYREYVQVQLLEPLVAGECYYVEFWSAPATQSDFFGVSHATTDAIGAYLDADKIGSEGISGVLSETPQIDNNASGNYIDPPGEWTRICGFFEAEGGEEWICIGNFHEDDETDVVAYEGGSLDATPLVYLFVDDVLVTPADSLAAAFLNDTIVCAPLTLNALTCGDTYLWSTGETTPSIIVYETGDYWVQIESSCGTLSDTAEIIFVVDTVNTTNTDIHICFTELPYTIEAFGGYDIYNWNTGETTSEIEIDEAGTYYLSAYTECSHFIDSFVVDVTEPINIGLDLGPDTLICAATWSLTLTAPAGYDSYDWNTGETTNSIVVSTPGNYSVIVYTECEVFNDAITITTDPNFGATINLGEDLELCPPAGISNFILVATEDLPNYNWNTGETTQTITVNQAGNYTVTSTLPCSIISDDVTVTLCNEIYVPNAFTPNGDGINDLFEIIIVDPSRILSFTIYNRWGELVFDGGAGAYQWNGKYNNEEAEMGMYAYIIVYSDANGENAILQGDVTLVR
ncbi:MAG: gliding motility-associated C-terminal domain-containing protein [Bacteroidetes bacterium]|nr:gliding motility-associated C-terminal domain-containing protein [Bacteroidota bacterium]